KSGILYDDIDKAYEEINEKNPSIRDMYRSLINHVILPAAYLEAHKMHHELDADALIEQLQSDRFIAKVAEVISPNPFHGIYERTAGHFIDAFLRPIRLSRASHHGGNSMPRDLRYLADFGGGLAWHPILPEPMTLSKTGVKIECLHTTAML